MIHFVNKSYRTQETVRLGFVFHVVVNLRPQLLYILEILDRAGALIAFLLLLLLLLYPLRVEWHGTEWMSGMDSGVLCLPTTRNRRDTFHS